MISHLQSLAKSRFVEMFGKELWQKKSIGDLALDIRYGTSKKASNAGKYTYLRMNNITDDGRLDFSDTKKIDLEDDELEKCTARKGDLLFNRTNSREKVGKTAVFMENDPMVIAGYIIRVRLGDEVRSQYLATFMNLPTTKSLLRSISKGAVHQANINSRSLHLLRFPCLQKKSKIPSRPSRGGPPNWNLSLSSKSKSCKRFTIVLLKSILGESCRASLRTEAGDPLPPNRPGG